MKLKSAGEKVNIMHAGEVQTSLKTSDIDEAKRDIIIISSNLVESLMSFTPTFPHPPTFLIHPLSIRSEDTSPQQSISNLLFLIFESRSENPCLFWFKKTLLTFQWSFWTMQLTGCSILGKGRVCCSFLKNMFQPQANTSGRQVA